MAMVPNVVPRQRAFRPLVSAVRRVANTAASCPACGSADVRRSHRRGFYDVVFACFLLVPFRCRMCRARFLQLWRPAFRTPAEAPSSGFVIMPPRVLEMHPVEPLRIANQPLRSRRPRPILILENDPSIRRLLCRVLDRRGYFPHEVRVPEKLPEELRERRVDLLIVDASLLSANGPDALIALARAHPNLKILALSPEFFAGAEISGRCLALAKPFSQESFIECVDRLLDPPALRANENGL